MGGPHLYGFTALSSSPPPTHNRVMARSRTIRPSCHTSKKACMYTSADGGNVESGARGGQGQAKKVVVQHLPDRHATLAGIPSSKSTTDRAAARPRRSGGSGARRPCRSWPASGGGGSPPPRRLTRTPLPPWRLVLPPASWGGLASGARRESTGPDTAGRGLPRCTWPGRGWGQGRVMELELFIGKKTRHVAPGRAGRSVAGHRSIFPPAPFRQHSTAPHLGHVASRACLLNRAARG